MGIKIINAGMFTTIQDRGRFKYQQFGMPVCGAMDVFSFHLANQLVHNQPDCEMLEATMMMPSMEILEDNVFAITGANCNPHLNGKSINMYQAYEARSGDVLELSAPSKGCRSYIAFHGGFLVPCVMGSKSTYTKGKIGGYDGRKLENNDVLSFYHPVKTLANMDERVADVHYVERNIFGNTVRVIMGPQEDYFSKEGLETFFLEEYQVTNEADRMGYRFNGPEIEHKLGEDGNIISDAIAFGAIQVPGHGKPIIMMADRQTTGGYTKIANVITVDLPKIAQLKPGDKIRFKRVSLKRAQQLLFEINK